MNKTISESLSEARDLISMIRQGKENEEKQKEMEKAEQYLLYIPELIKENKHLTFVRLKHPKTLLSAYLVPALALKFLWISCAFHG